MIHRIILIILIYFTYRSIKSWYLSNFSKNSPNLDGTGHKGNIQIEGDMIQDPYCNVYFSKNEGVHLRENGQDYIFCSTKCRDAFVSSRK